MYCSYCFMWEFPPWLSSSSCCVKSVLPDSFGMVSVPFKLEENATSEKVPSSFPSRCLSPCGFCCDSLVSPMRHARSTDFAKSRVHRSMILVKDLCVYFSDVQIHTAVVPVALQKADFSGEHLDLLSFRRVKWWFSFPVRYNKDICSWPRSAQAGERGVLCGLAFFFFFNF